MMCSPTEICEPTLDVCGFAPPDFPSWMVRSERQKYIDSCPSLKAYHGMYSETDHCSGQDNLASVWVSPV